MPLMTANSFAGWAVEATYGQAASVATFTPVASPKVTPGVMWLDDSDLRGSPVMHYDQVPGVFKATYDAKTFTYTDVYPNLLRAMLGSTDTVASVGPGTYTHTIGLINSPNTGSQAPSYTIINDSVDATYRMVASRLNTLSVSFVADAAVENTFSWITNQPQTSSSVSPVNESVQHLVPAWACSASINGAGVAVLESIEIDMKRNAAQIFTVGTQSAYENWQGPLEVSGKITAVVEQGETYWANALVRDQQAIYLQLLDPVSGFTIGYQMSACQLENPTIVQSKAYVELTTDFTACANLIDPVNIGYSPIKTIVTNGVSSAY